MLGFSYSVLAASIITFFCKLSLHVVPWLCFLCITVICVFVWVRYMSAPPWLVKSCSCTPTLVFWLNHLDWLNFGPLVGVCLSVCVCAGLSLTFHPVLWCKPPLSLACWPALAIHPSTIITLCFLCFSFHCFFSAACQRRTILSSVVQHVSALFPKQTSFTLIWFTWLLSACPHN